jgi:hypothetical protein
VATRLAFVTLLALSACERDAKPAAQTAAELTGTPAERVTMVRDLLTAPDSLSGTITDAHFREQRTGDGNLGPSDFVAFFALSVAPAEIGIWLRALPPLEGAVPTAPPSPSTPTAWWVPPNEFSSLRFFGSGSVTGRSTGWVGVDSARGRVYAYTFTQ